MIIGDVTTGYVITPVTSDVSEILIQSAKKKGVPINTPWSKDGYEDKKAVVEGFSPTNAVDSQLVSGFVQLTSDSKAQHVKRSAGTRPSDVLNKGVVTKYLIQIALQRKTITYGLCLEYFNLPCNQGTVGVLTRVLDIISDQTILENKPNISSLVVNKKEGLPGAGFFKHTNLARGVTKSLKHEFFNQEVLKIWDYYVG